MTPSSSSPVPPAGGAFPTTIWSAVRQGAAADQRREALERLARRYQAPAEGFLRVAFRVDAGEASDLFQSFFVRLLEDDFLARADPARGRFRSFLKTALRHFATDEFRKRRALRRGGDGNVELEAVGEPAAPDRDRPEEELDRAWRRAWIEAALEDTRRELEGAGKEGAFLLFRDYYLAAEEKPDYRRLAERHGVTTTDVSNRLMRAKRIFRGHLRARVVETVDSEEDLAGELSWLLEGGRP